MVDTWFSYFVIFSIGLESVEKIVLTKGTVEISSKIVTKSSFVFEKYLIENGETDLLYKGLTRISTKYGVLESAFLTRYGYTMADQFKKIIYEYGEAKVPHYILNLLFEDFNHINAFYDTL